MKVTKPLNGIWAGQHSWKLRSRYFTTCDYSAVDSSRLLDALTLYSDHMFLLLLWSYSTNICFHYLLIFITKTKMLFKHDQTKLCSHSESELLFFIYLYDGGMKKMTFFILISTNCWTSVCAGDKCLSKLFREQKLCQTHSTKGQQTESINNNPAPPAQL